MYLRKNSTIILAFLLLLNVIYADVADNSVTSRREVEKKQDFGQDKEPKEKELESKTTPLFKALLKDSSHILTSPTRMRSKDFLLWGGVAALTGVLIANDEAIYKEMKRFQSKNKWVDDISPQITRLGSGEWNLGVAGAFFLGGVLLKDKKAKETARLTLMTFIHTGLVVQIGKHLTSRQRPSWNQGRDGWTGPAGFFKRYKKGQLSRYDAFPSGHTISVFGTATVIAEMYKKSPWVPVLSYSLATLCGLSRVTEDTHWLSDVFLAAVLGYAIGKFVVKRRNSQGKLRIYPVAGGNQVSLGVNYSF